MGSKKLLIWGTGVWARMDTLNSQKILKSDIFILSSLWSPPKLCTYSFYLQAAVKALICRMNKKHPSCQIENACICRWDDIFRFQGQGVSFSPVLLFLQQQWFSGVCSHQQSSSQSEGRTWPWNILTAEERRQSETANFVQISHLAAKIFFKKPAEVIINDFAAIYRRAKNSKYI